MTQTQMTTNEVVIGSGAVRLPGTLLVPAAPVGLVIFAHGSGSSRRSPRNISVARRLGERGCASLLFDLLTPGEAVERANVFDIPLLAGRMVAATNWAAGLEDLDRLPRGYFGASTGAAAALVASTQTTEPIAAVVSRGGRPDLAGAALAEVRAPTLLLVGALDALVLELNERAIHSMTCQKWLTVIEDASHLFEEPGTLEAVAEHATDWFLAHFGDARSCPTAG